MNDCSLRSNSPADPNDVPSLAALWFAAEAIGAGSSGSVTVGSFELAPADGSTTGGARLAGAGFRADPSDAATSDALVRAARDAIARARTAPESIDAVACADSAAPVLDVVVPARPRRLDDAAAGPLRAALGAIERGTARRVLVLERPLGAIAQAAVVEATQDGSPTFHHGAIEPAPVAPVASQATAAAALRAFGLDVPLPPALTVGLVAAAASPDAPDMTTTIRALALRGTAVVVAPATPFSAAIDRARRLIASGCGTAFVVVGPGEAAVVASVGFRRAITAT